MLNLPFVLSDVAVKVDIDFGQGFIFLHLGWYVERVQVILLDIVKYRLLFCSIQPIVSMDVRVLSE